MNEELKVIISAEIDKLKKGVENAQKQISSFKNNVSKYSKNIDADFKAIGEGITSGLKVAATAVAGAGAGLLALAGTTAEYRTEQSKLTTAFETAGASAETAKTVYNDLYRVLGDSGVSVEAANHLAKLTTNQQDLSEWTTICQGVYATFGESLPIEGLTEAANETAKVGTLTGSLADALNWAGINEEAFQAKLDACNTEAEREALIRETLNGLYTDAAANYETNNAALLAQNEAQARLSENLAVVGDALQPVLTALTSMAADCLAVITPYITSFVDNYLPSIVSLLGEVSGALETALNWMVEHSTTLGVIAGVIGTVVAAIGLYNAVAAVKAAMDAAQVATLGGLIAAQLAHAAAALAAIAPYVLIVAAIAAVIAIIVLCVKHWDEIKAVVVKVANMIWTKVKEMAEKVVEWFSNMKEKVGEAVDNIKSIATEKFNAVKDTITDAVGAAKDTAVESLKNMKSAYQEHGGGIKGITAAAMEGVKGYYKTGFSFIDTLTGGKLSSIASKFKSKMGEAGEAVSGVLDNIKSYFSDKLDGAKKLVSDAVQKIKDTFNFSWSLPKPKFPKFKVSGGVAPWGFAGQGSLPSIKISWNALGGVFDKPTVFGYGGSLQGIGEAGAEAVVPLEKNTQWLDRIAERLAAKQGNTPIILTVDGKVFAQTSIDSINQLTRQTGHLALNIL